jgi:hypothetical protein
MEHGQRHTEWLLRYWFDLYEHFWRFQQHAVRLSVRELDGKMNWFAGLVEIAPCAVVCSASEE